MTSLTRRIPRSSSEAKRVAIQAAPDEPEWETTSLYKFNVTQEGEPLEYVGLNHHGGGERCDLEFISTRYEWRLSLINYGSLTVLRRPL